MKKLFSILLIIFGSFLEILYYKFRFEQDGIETWLALTIGIALTLFLALAVFHKSKPLVIALIIYSVLATSAGQSFSLSVYQNKIVKEDAKELNIQDDIIDLENRIIILDKEYTRLQKTIDNSVENLQDLYTYRRPLRTIRPRMDEIVIERNELRIQLSELRSQANYHKTIDKKDTNIYMFYNSLTTIDVYWLQFFFQTLLSLFIAFMAPLGIIILIKDKKIISKTKTPKPIILGKNYWRPWVERWVHANWMGRRTGKSKNILPEKVFFEFTSSIGKAFPRNVYKSILNTARKEKVLDTNMIKYYHEVEAVNKIVNGLIKNDGGVK